MMVFRGVWFPYFGLKKKNMGVRVVSGGLGFPTSDPKTKDGDDGDGGVYLPGVLVSLLRSKKKMLVVVMGVTDIRGIWFPCFGFTRGEKGGDH